MDLIKINGANKSSMYYISGRRCSWMIEHSSWGSDQQQQWQNIMGTTF